MNAVEYRVESGPRPEGSQWAHLRDAAQSLREEVEFMAAVLALADGHELDDTQLVTLDIERSLLDDSDPADIASDLVAGYALDVNVARWSNPDAMECLARVEIVTGTGGPHVEIIAQYSTTGSLERVEKNTYWSGAWKASTEDCRALEIVAAFIDSFVAF